MGLSISKNVKNRLNGRGDTIVEVLIAIAIAGFAIGISYATAQRSLQQAISAREHNEALNILENQITDLRVRFQAYANTPDDFNTAFADKNNYCLDDSAKIPTDASWNVYSNYSNINTSATDTASLSSSNTPNGSHPYYYSSPNGCQQQKPGDGAVYYINIATSNPNPTGVNSTLYHVTVRWARLGGGVSRASLFYKLNYDPVVDLGSSGGIGPPPPSCSGTFPWLIGEEDKASPPRLALQNANGRRAMYGSWPAAWTVSAGCTYTIEITTKDASTADPNQQMFVELCADISATTCSLTGNSASTLYTSGALTSDISASANGTYSDTFNLSSMPKYILFKHCSLWSTTVGTCKNSSYMNDVASYDIKITGS